MIFVSKREISPADRGVFSQIENNTIWLCLAAHCDKCNATIVHTVDMPVVSQTVSRANKDVKSKTKRNTLASRLACCAFGLNVSERVYLVGTQEVKYKYLVSWNNIRSSMTLFGHWCSRFTVPPVAELCAHNTIHSNDWHCQKKTLPTEFNTSKMLIISFSNVISRKNSVQWCDTDPYCPFT